MVASFHKSCDNFSPNSELPTLTVFGSKDNQRVAAGVRLEPDIAVPSPPAGGSMVREVSQIGLGGWFMCSSDDCGLSRLRMQHQGRRNRHPKDSLAVMQASSVVLLDTADTAPNHGQAGEIIISKPENDDADACRSRSTARPVVHELAANCAQKWLQISEATPNTNPTGLAIPLSGFARPMPHMRCR